MVRHTNLDLYSPFGRNYASLNTFFDDYQTVFDDVKKDASFPYFDIIKNNTSKEVIVRLALAGYDKEEIDAYIENNIFTVQTIDNFSDSNQDEDTKYIHKGIAKRAFSKRFTLSPHLVYKGSSFQNGMLEFVFENKYPNPEKIIISG